MSEDHFKKGQEFFQIFLKVKEFTARLEPEFRELIDRFRSHYDPDKIAALDLPYT